MSWSDWQPIALSIISLLVSAVLAKLHINNANAQQISQTILNTTVGELSALKTAHAATEAKADAALKTTTAMVAAAVSDNPPLPDGKAASVPFMGIVK